MTLKNLKCFLLSNFGLLLHALQLRERQALRVCGVVISYQLFGVRGFFIFVDCSNITRQRMVTLLDWNVPCASNVLPEQHQMQLLLDVCFGFHFRLLRLTAGVVD